LRSDPTVADRVGIARDTGTEAEHETTLHQVIDHRDLRRGHRGVIVRKRQHSGAEGDRRAGVGEMRDEREARGDRLGGVDQVLADERLAIAKAISQHHGLSVFAQDVGVGARRRVDRLDEETELQSFLHERAPKKQKPRRFRRRGFDTDSEALAGAVLSDDNCDELLQNFHAGQSTTLTCWDSSARRRPRA
jgi:hypothetical protein